MNENKTCLDCLHCKVSALSTDNCRLCFCEMSEKKNRHKEIYWYRKTPCESFFDMTENTLLVIKATKITDKRIPLLRGKQLERQRY